MRLPLLLRSLSARPYALGLLLMAVTALSPISFASRPPLRADRPIVYGSAAFQAKVNGALDLLEVAAPEAYGRAIGHLTQIIAGDRSGALVQTGTFVIGPSSWQADEVWLASIIVHDSIHVEQYVSGRPFVGEQAEAEAMRLQIEVLELLGAEEYLLSFAKQAMALRYWEVPLDQRDW